MKNAWKGLVVGGLTGVAAGVVLDALQRASDSAHRAGRLVAAKAPVVAGQLGDAAEHGLSRLYEADRSGSADPARRAAEHIANDHR